MRWIFADRGNSREGRGIAEIEQSVEAWWREFDGKRGDLTALFANKQKWDLPEWMQEHFSTIDEHLMWEYGRAVKGDGHRLVITAEGTKELRPFANSVVANAPSFAGWEFYPYRLAESMKDTALTVEARTGASIDGVEVVVQREANNRVALKFRSPTFRGPDDNDSLNTAFVITETLLGEEVLDHWIGEISVDKAKKGLLGFGKSKGDAVALEKMPGRVAALIQEIKAGLPAKPHYEFFENAEWALLRLEPEEADDYPGRADLITWTTLNPDLFAATLQPGFHSPRFSNFKETFCYLKIDSEDGLEGCRFSDRSDMEDALNEMLAKSKTGCVTGGGTGLRYSYIDLAVLEFTKTARAIVQMLREANLPNRSWLLFHDADYCGEWLGVYDDTPEPPQFDDDD